MASLSIERLCTAEDGTPSAVRVCVCQPAPRHGSVLLRLLAAAVLAAPATAAASLVAVLPSALAYVAAFSLLAAALGVFPARAHARAAEAVVAVRGVGVQVDGATGVLGDVRRLCVGEACGRLAFGYVLWAVRDDGRAEVLFGESRPRLALLLEARRALDAVLFPNAARMES